MFRDCLLYEYGKYVPEFEVPGRYRCSLLFLPSSCTNTAPEVIIEIESPTNTHSRAISQQLASCINHESVRIKYAHARFAFITRTSALQANHHFYPTAHSAPDETLFVCGGCVAFNVRRNERKYEKKKHKSERKHLTFGFLSIPLQSWKCVTKRPEGCCALFFIYFKYDRNKSCSG